VRLLTRTNRVGHAADDVTTPLERVVIGVVSLVVAVVAIAALSGVFAANDQPGVTGATVGPGLAFADLGHAHLTAGAPAPHYNSNPPTSGPHIPERVVRDQTRLNHNQVLQALELGDVVVVYGGRTPPPGLAALARAEAAPFSPALAEAGQAVILARRPGTHGLIGLAWTRMLRVSDAGAPALHDFAQFWLGRGAPGR
jgi:hypothetical protein